MDEFIWGFLDKGSQMPLGHVCVCYGRATAGALGISAGKAFGLLEVIGGECAGALSLYPAGETPPSSDDDGVELLSPARLEEILGKLRERPLLGGEEGVRLSLAGAQDKLAVWVEGENIGLAKGGRPTTHILKPCIQALDGTVGNELFCLGYRDRLRLHIYAVRRKLYGAGAARRAGQPMVHAADLRLVLRKWKLEPRRRLWRHAACALPCRCPGDVAALPSQSCECGQMTDIPAVTAHSDELASARRHQIFAIRLADVLPRLAFRFYFAIVPWLGTTDMWIAALFRDGEILTALFSSAVIAAGVIAISLPVGTAAALLLTSLHGHARGFFYAMVSPLLTPGVVIGIATLLFWRVVGIGGGVVLSILAGRRSWAPASSHFCSP